jgi:hypothetical protein
MYLSHVMLLSGISTDLHAYSKHDAACPLATFDFCLLFVMLLYK